VQVSRCQLAYPTVDVFYTFYACVGARDGQKIDQFCVITREQRDGVFRITQYYRELSYYSIIEDLKKKKKKKKKQ